MSHAVIHLDIWRQGKYLNRICCLVVDGSVKNTHNLVSRLFIRSVPRYEARFNLHGVQLLVLSADWTLLVENVTLFSQVSI